MFSTPLTVAHVLHRRPDVLVVTNPPCPAALVGWAIGRLVGATVVLDSHPGAFGAQGDRVAARLQPLHRWVTRHADLSIVASQEWLHAVEAWGAEAVVVHEAPGDWRPAPLPGRSRLRLLYVGRFAADEPWRALIDAASSVPEIDVAVTGDARGAGIAARRLPPNVTLVGFLDATRYQEAVYDADAIVALTTEPGSIMRAACEAVWAQRPLVVSDWPALRAAFPYALHVHNDPAAIAAGLRQLAATYPARASQTGAARDRQVERWECQRRRLTASLSLLPGDAAAGALDGQSTAPAEHSGTEGVAGFS
jgi:glycosyltransferase involved in cell wall biosynthesis